MPPIMCGSYGITLWSTLARRGSIGGVRARPCSVVAVVPFWLNSFSRNPFGYLNRYDSYGQSQRSP
jgi:hypothetical protein